MPTPATPPPADLFARSVRTLAASWGLFAEGSPGARLITEDGASIGVFVASPEREIFNNALLLPGAADAKGVLATITAAYRDASIDRYAVWVHQDDQRGAAAVAAADLWPDEATRVMARSLDALPDEAAGPALELGPARIADLNRVIGVPDDLIPHAGEGAHVYVARLDGAPVAGLLAFDHDGDCGIYNVGTVASARRQGLATRLTLRALHHARDRGCTTASLQSTPEAERVYAALGFHDLGRFVEHVTA